MRYRALDHRHSTVFCEGLMSSRKLGVGLDPVHHVSVVDCEHGIKTINHPGKSEVRKRCVVVATTDVAVHSREPALLQNFQVVRLDMRPIPDCRGK